MGAASIRLALSCALSNLLAFFAGLASAFYGLTFVREILLLFSRQEMPDGSWLGLLVGLLAFSLSLGLLAIVLLRRGWRPYLRHAVAPAE
jgi:hypothetical protein